MIKVKFVRAYSMYNEGEYAGFSQPEAERLIQRGYAISASVVEEVPETVMEEPIEETTEEVTEETTEPSVSAPPQQPKTKSKEK